MAHVKLRCDKLAFMGGICGKPSPPPDSDLVGHWVSDERAEVKGRSTSAMYRVARGYRPAIVGCGGNGKEYMRLEIHPSGWINYLKAEKDSFVTLIDMPVRSWDHGIIKVEFVPSGSLRYQMKGQALRVNGMTLFKALAQ